MAAGRHAGYRSHDVTRGREVDLEHCSRSKEYYHRHPSRDRDSSRRLDGGRSGGHEMSRRHRRHRSRYVPPRSRQSRREVDREPGEVSSGSGSEDYGCCPPKARVPREDGAVGVCRDGVVLPPSKKRKHTPIQGAHVSDWLVRDDVKSIKGVDTAVAEIPLPSPPPLSDASSVATATGCSPMNLDVSVVLNDDERLHEHEKNGIKKGEEECPTMRNIFTSRWADADEEEEETIVPPKKKSVSPANLVERRSTKEATGLGPGQLRRSSSSYLLGSENCNLMDDGGDCMDVEEDGIDSSTFCSSDTDSKSDVRRSRLAVVVLPQHRCFNMLQGCRSIDEFERLNTINEGTYGVVFRVRDKKTGDIVALKKVKMDKEREGFPLTSLREINTLLSFDHSSIVDVKEVVVGGHEDDTFVVMEYMEHDLRGVMETMKQPYTQSEVKCLMLQLLEGVKYLHDNWVLHRDLKTSNLLLNNRGESKICDFGLSRQYGSPLKPYTQPVVTL